MLSSWHRAQARALPRGRRLHTAPRPMARGLSLVELMVGVAIGLFITAAAAMLVSAQLASNRQLLVETQIQQDLRATADIIKRDLRRASYVPNNDTFVFLLGNTSPPERNLSSDIALTAGAGGSTLTEYRYTRGTNTGYALRVTADGVLQRGLDAGAGVYNWQPLTDANVLRITQFTVRTLPGATPVTDTLQCPNLCPDGTGNCWPKVEVRELEILLRGQSATGVPVSRQIVDVVKIRNDVVRFGSLVPPRVCP